MNKLRVYAMGLLTVCMVPVSWLLMGLPEMNTFLQIDVLFSNWTGFGIGFGFLFGAIMVLVTQGKEARNQFEPQIQAVRSMRLNLIDCLFLSFCAGLGEEFLFRAALQQWLHPIITSVIFVAIHGYIHPTKWKTTKYGLIILGFIIVLGYAASAVGIWFCIAAHASYDFVLFRFWSKSIQSKT